MKARRRWLPLRLKLEGPVLELRYQGSQIVTYSRRRDQQLLRGGLERGELKTQLHSRVHISVCVRTAQTKCQSARWSGCFLTGPTGVYKDGHKDRRM